METDEIKFHAAMHAVGLGFHLVCSTQEDSIPPIRRENASGLTRLIASSTRVMGDIVLASRSHEQTWEDRKDSEEGEMKGT